MRYFSSVARSLSPLALTKVALMHQEHLLKRLITGLRFKQPHRISSFPHDAEHLRKGRDVLHATPAAQPALEDDMPLARIHKNGYKLSRSGR